eukprot:superscaffoldBa00011547_g25266
MTSLTAKDKVNVKAFWDKFSTQHAGRVPADLDLLRPLEGLESANVRKHGRSIMAGVAGALTKIGDLKGGLLSLSELHAFTLRVDPANFKIISHNILVVLAIIFHADFTPEFHVAMNKFLTAVALALAENFKALSDTQPASKMTSLTAKDKSAVKAFWAKIAPKADDIGADALS